MRAPTQLYSTDFFRNIQRGASESARQVVPLVVGLLQPNSVLDVGCGGGDWLSVFYHDCHISDVLGIDGDYVGASALALPPAAFLPHDLSTPLHLHRRFDLVVSLEVAEHIPFEHADTFVENLTRHGDAVLFSAAIPGQDGVHHVNEQFPEYWAAVFRQKGFSVVDVLRTEIWKNKRVKWWYRQNILLFLKNECLEKRPDLQRVASQSGRPPLTRIHPALFFQPGCYRRLFPAFNLPRFVFSLTRTECRQVVDRLMEKSRDSEQREESNQTPPRAASHLR